MIFPSTYESEHFMVLPSPQFWNTPSELNFMVSFSGVAVLQNFIGKQNGDWNKDTLQLSAFPMRMDKILERVKNVLPPQPSGTNSYSLIPLQWTIYASVNAQFDKDTSVNAGFAANNFKILKTLVYPNQNSTQQVSVFDGMLVDIAVRDKDAIIYRIGYEINIYGYFIPIYVPPIN